APAAHLVEGESKYRLSEKVEGETPCWAWREGNTIYCYAKGFTDSNKKLPLKSAIKGIFTKVKIVNHTQVDTVSGATTTADALKAAIEDALTQARGGE
ncbi:MAG: FMN-binding protein, partial [Spirochaetaceae bacterium]|nr:FMN-binding protein [Spirochaetaceae bacterium]